MDESLWETLFTLEPEEDPKPCAHHAKWCRPIREDDPDHPSPTLCEAWRCRCGHIVIGARR